MRSIFYKDKTFFKIAQLKFTRKYKEKLKLIWTTVTEKLNILDLFFSDFPKFFKEIHHVIV